MHRNTNSHYESIQDVFEIKLSLSTFFVRALRGGVGFVWLLGLFLYALSWIGIISTDHYPKAIQQSVYESGINIWTRLIYLFGPISGILSIGICSLLSHLERILRLRKLVVKIEDSAENQFLLEQANHLHKRCSEVSATIPDDDMKSPQFQEYCELSRELSRKKRQLLGGRPISFIAFVALLSFNWYAFVLQITYGPRWAFVSEWIAYPILVIWFLILLICSVVLFRDNWK